MENYHMLKIIGQGCFGKVFKGRRRYSGQIVALKFISKRGKSEKDLQNLRLEMGILQKLDHPNIIRMFESFETNSDFVVVTEFAYGELFEIFQDDKYLPEDEVRNISRQLVQALNYIHMQKVIHRDMKPQNVLVGANDVVKLCDFGFARAMSNQTTVLTSVKGTPLYMAPELVQEKPYDCSVDLWSLGVICYELVIGQPPFYTNSLISLIQLIVQTPVQYPDSLSVDFKSFLQGLLQKNPKQRLGWPNLLHHPFLKEPNCSSPIRRQAQENQLPTKPVPTVQVEPASSTSLSDLNRWLHVFVEFLACPPSASGGEHLNDAINDKFATFCLCVLTAYGDVLENGSLSNSSSQLEHAGLLLALCGEPQKGQLPLSPLVRSLAQILGSISPPASFVQCMCNSNSLAICLLRIIHVLGGKQAEAWGPPWDLISDILRLLGLGFRAPIALGMGLSDELLRPDGPLIQYTALVPTLVFGGITGRFCVPSNSGVNARVTVHHLGTAVNSIKCLGVVFSHFVQAMVTYPPASFVIELFQCLSDNCAGVQQNPNDADLDSSGYMVLAICAVCQCVLFRPVPGSSSERLVRAALQTMAALLHPGPGGLTRAGVPWGGGSPCMLPSSAAEAARFQAALQGAREVVRRSFRESLSEPGLCASGSCEMDHAIFGLLWSLRTTSGGERLDASTLKILIGLTNTSVESAQMFAEHRGVADSFRPDAVGPCEVLAITEATCAGAADQNPGSAWPSVGLLLALLAGCLRHCGTLPLTSLGITSNANNVAPPSWCTPGVVYALVVRLQSSLSRSHEAVLPMLTASYAFELITALCAALLQQNRHSDGQIFTELKKALSPVETVLDIVLNSMARGRIGRLCLDDMRKAEGVFYGCVMRGPLDGILSVCVAHQLLEKQHGNHSALARNTVSFLLREDPQTILSVTGPKGLLLLLELLHSFRDNVEASAVSLRFCLALLWTLQTLSVLPTDDSTALPSLVVAFHAIMDLILRIFGTVSQVNVMAGSTELHADFQDAKTIPAIMHLLAVAPRSDAGSFKTTEDTSWQAVCSGMQLLSTLVLHHQTLAHEFVENQGVQMLVNRNLLTLELACADASGSQIVIDALLILSQLSRLSKEYYPLLHQMHICGDLRNLLGCANASVRAKACNTIGNMARHSDSFYPTMQQCGILPQLIHLCSDSDSACRKFASFAVGNAAFHSDVLYPVLASAVSPLLCLLKDDDEKTRANAAGAIGNLVRNSTDLCGAMIQEGALHGLFNLVESRLPRHASDPGALDSSVKISLFSLGNLAMHSDCRAFMKSSMRIRDLCNQLLNCSPCDDVIRKYAQRLLQKLESA